MPPPAPGESTDEQLMRAYVNGDATAFDALYARQGAGLFRFVRRLLGAALAAQVDEVFQDTWMRIVAARHTFDAGDGRWRSWAFAIAHNAAMDRLRTSGREVGLDERDDGSDPLEWLQARQELVHPSSEDVAHWRAAGTRLLHCLEQLPAAQRAAFLLHHEDGASLEELAARLELGFETVKSRLRYALQKLRGCMRAYLEPMELAR